jgi:hypothetical protein
MHKMILVHCILWLSLLLSQSTFAQPQKIKEYTVTKGDTLWSIADKELHDPFLWPKIWKENPEIKNPDRLFPGQRIKIPLYLIQKTGEEEKPAPAVKKEPMEEGAKKLGQPVVITITPPLVEKHLLISSGYISNSIPGVGRIIGSPSGRNLWGNNDIVYVKTDGPVAIGDRFYIVRVGELVSQPVTNKKMGYVIEIVGIAEISKFEYGETEAKIYEIFDHVMSGDLLDPYYEINPPLVKEPYRRPDIEGTIVGTRNLRLTNSNYDIVYIDKGVKDGIEIGDMFRTLEVGEHRIPNGVIQIILLRDNTSTAIVRKGSMPVERGNLFVPLEED